MTKSYGYKELHNCLTSLGFYPEDNNSSHIKYYHKEGKTGKYPFIMDQVNLKTYQKNAKSRYISELKMFGFTKEKIENNLKK